MSVSIPRGGIRLRATLPELQLQGAADVHVTSCCSDSRHVKPGDLFVALCGSEQDGHQFVSQAVQRGAAAVLAERQLAVGGRPLGIVPDSAEAYGRICHALAGEPSRQLKVIGVTGTNGKTTTTRLAAAAVAERVGTLGTLGCDDTCEAVASTHTTPPPSVTAEWLGRMVANHCTHAVMEVSSHALVQRRVAGIELDAVCLTNVTQDHLDYHGSLALYRKAKARIFDRLIPDGAVVLNLDDPICADMIPRIHHPLLTVGMSPQADVRATVVERTPADQTLLITAGCETAALRTPLLGDHNVTNCLLATGLGLLYGRDLAAIVRGLESVEHVPGRLERIECGQPFSVYVDYAHTPAALEAALAAVRPVTSGRVICVFGAGGNRDRVKRPRMGRVAAQGADLVVITNDNPRGEDARAIACQIERGFPSDAVRPWVVLNRSEAIAIALAEAEPGDTVLIAGKGHEDYQEIGRRRVPSDDRRIARSILYQMSPTTAPLRVVG